MLDGRSELFLHPPIQVNVRQKRIAFIARLMKQNRFPKLTHRWNVFGPINLGDVVEDDAQNLVFANARVEFAHKQLDVMSRFDVGTSFIEKREQDGTCSFRRFVRTLFHQR